MDSNDLLSTFLQSPVSDVFHCDVVEPSDLQSFTTELTANGWFVALVDASAIDSKESLMSVLSQSLRFPPYFGHNWDALIDCLTDLDWLEANDVGLILNDWKKFATQQPQLAEVFTEVLGFVKDRLQGRPDSKRFLIGRFN